MKRIVLLFGLLLGASANPGTCGEPKLSWSMAPPLFRLAKADSDAPAVLVDPAVVRHADKWHLFAGTPGGVLYYQLDDFKADGPVVRGKKLSLTGGGAVPQVYYHRASKQWHLIGHFPFKDADGKMRNAPCLSTNDAIDNPDGWSKVTRLDVALPRDEQDKPVGWMDFYVVFDEQKVHLFGTSGGRLWRTETTVGDFPRGWSKPVVALKASIVYASHTYRQETDTGWRFLTTITASAKDPKTQTNKQFQVSYVAEKLDGPWSPELVKWDDPFVGLGNATIADPRWSGEIVHGEPLRSGNDERMILDRDVTGFVFHGRAKLKDAATAPAQSAVGFLERVTK